MFTVRPHALFTRPTGFSINGHSMKMRVLVPLLTTLIACSPNSAFAGDPVADIVRQSEVLTQSQISSLRMEISVVQREMDEYRGARLAGIGATVAAVSVSALFWEQGRTDKILAWGTGGTFAFGVWDLYYAREDMQPLREEVAALKRRLDQLENP